MLKLGILYNRVFGHLIQILCKKNRDCHLFRYIDVKMVNSFSNQIKLLIFPFTLHREVRFTSIKSLKSVP